MLKKLFVFVCCLCVFTGNALADTSLYYNDRPLLLQEAVVEKDSDLYFPLRCMFEALAFTIGWNDATQAVTISGKVNVELKIGSKSLYIDGKTQAISHAPEIINNLTYVPSELVAAVLGGTITQKKDCLYIVSDIPALEYSTYPGTDIIDFGTCLANGTLLAKGLDGQKNMYYLYKSNSSDKDEYVKMMLQNGWTLETSTSPLILKHNKSGKAAYILYGLSMFNNNAIYTVKIGW